MLWSCPRRRRAPLDPLSPEMWYVAAEAKEREESSADLDVYLGWCGRCVQLRGLNGKETVGGILDRVAAVEARKSRVDAESMRLLVGGKEFSKDRRVLTYASKEGFSCVAVCRSRPAIDELHCLQEQSSFESDRGDRSGSLERYEAFVRRRTRSSASA